VLDITSGGLDAGTINTCPNGLCGTTTAYTYQSGGNVSGTITLSTSGTTGTATFDVQLTSIAQFSAGEQLTAGTFTAPVSIPISLSGSSWSQTGSPVFGSNSGVTFNTLTASQNAPQISGLTCSSTLTLCGFPGMGRTQSTARSARYCPGYFPGLRIGIGADAYMLADGWTSESRVQST
jgi:hypothetical protein